MPRPIWSGSISFGLVNVPVKLFTAQSPKDVRFNQLHGTDHSRVRMKRFCEVENVEIPFDEIVKGYEIGPDQYVVIEPKELEEFDPKATHTIDIEEFVHLDQIDPIFYERAYYLVPDERSAKPYRLLAEALARQRQGGDRQVRHAHQAVPVRGAGRGRRARAEHDALRRRGDLGRGPRHPRR